MLLDWVISILVFLVIGSVSGLPLALRLRVSPAEKLCAAIAFSIGIAYVCGFACFLAGLSPAWACLAVPVTAVGFIGQGPALREFRADPEVRSLLGVWPWLACWGLALLGVIRCYSGGNLVGDWLEHYQRAFYFCGTLPADYKFIGMYSLPARPPLTNVVTAVLLKSTRFDFAHYQLFMTLEGSLCWFPVGLLALRLAPKGRRMLWLLALLLAANALFDENLVYSWTKLQSGFFVLCGLAFYLEGRATGSFTRCQLAFVCLSLGALSHYSAAVYLVVLGVIFLAEQQRAHPPFGALGWRWSVLVAENVALYATWFPWSIHAFGSGTTYSSNTTVSSYLVRTPSKIAHDFLVNLYYTSVPHFMRGGSDDFIATTGRWGPLRDFFFFAYQQEIPLLAGLGGLIILVGLAARRARCPASYFWPAFLGGVLFLGILVNDLVNVWGYAHICLQPVAYLAVALVAARWSDLPRPWRALAAAGYCLDLLAGVVLPFCLQSVDLIGLVHSQGYTAERIAQNYGTAGALNLLSKNNLHLRFFADDSGIPVVVSATVAAALLGIGLLMVLRGSSGNASA
ncbi:MAG TPA: hypothetical protein VIJ19_07440 [Opitutaceae bacterium]